ncbi:MAG: PEP/pyruvate-binding domain-containing protein [Desulfosarcinaceae bacterium]|nr:PEP/pyruvate-binding domain-containing protein [Desulfosarcinaceae bacterium]
MVAADLFTPSDFDTHFKVYHELMAHKVLEILLVASPYDAYILEEDGSLAAKIINEYSGLNLSRPPRLTREASAEGALEAVGRRRFDLVLAMPNPDDLNTYLLGMALKERQADLPVILLAHSIKGLPEPPGATAAAGIDQIFIWSGDADLLLAIVKSVEDRLNAPDDTGRAMTRILLLVEDSPLYRSYLLPRIYREVVRQTQNILEESLNEEHRLLKMRARLKILVAGDYENAWSLFQTYRDYLFGVISDTRFPRAGRVAETAGYELLRAVKGEIPDLPLLLLSTESQNRERAARIPAQFLDKNDPQLFNKLHDYFMDYLGFGDFVFRTAAGKEVGRAGNLKMLEKILPQIPEEPLCYHASRNRFSNWIMARGEITLASMLRRVQVSDFDTVAEMRAFIIASIRSLRLWRQKGVVADFRSEHYDPEISDFVKIGRGSLGGKARGLAFVANLLRQSHDLVTRYPDVTIQVPRTLVITTTEFDAFVEENELESLLRGSLSDTQIARRFDAGDFSEEMIDSLACFLEQVTYPLSVRSSSLLEDAHFHPFAGLYKTFMVPNNHPDPAVRLAQLCTAIKLVYASLYFRAPRRYSDSAAFQLRKESMAVMIQQMVGRQYGDFFYPAISGVAQSQNYYPVGHLKPEEGVARIALGFGESVLGGKGGLRFCPRHPNYLPQFSKLEDILDNAQQQFYALRMRDNPDQLYFERGGNIEPREIHTAEAEFPVRALSSTYLPAEGRVRDGAHHKGPKLLTFAAVLKYGQYPLASILADILTLGRQGMGCPVEFEFSMNLNPEDGERHAFHLLQMRPMSAAETPMVVEISDEERATSFCYSRSGLGHGRFESIRDIVQVSRRRFDAGETVAIAQEIAALNARLAAQGRTYLLMGPGRWGSFDRWLGIPVKWRDIAAVGAMVELRNAQLSADASQGSHFLQQITSRGIPYITVTEADTPSGNGALMDDTVPAVSDRRGRGQREAVRWHQLEGAPVVSRSRWLNHLQTATPLMIKCNGRSSECVIQVPA